jgi:hypothetical protein
MRFRSKSRRALQPGDLRLIHDLAVLGRVIDGERMPIEERLEHRLGADFARTVRASLAEPTARAA